MEKRGDRKHLSPQLTFSFRRRDGHRAGRKAKSTSGVPHLIREPLESRFPVHVVMKLRPGLPGLRGPRPYKLLRSAFAAGRDRFGFRLNQYSVQGDHLHLIVEAENRKALSRGLKGLAIRIAKGLNKLWNHQGSLFADRYFDRILRTPLEVKNAIQYVLHNGSKHGSHRGPGPDHYSSGDAFDGWRRFAPASPHHPTLQCLAPAATWLQRLGWRRHGLIPVSLPPQPQRPPLRTQPR